MIKRVNATVALCLTLLFLAPFALAEPPKPFEVVLVPDTQNYAEKFPETYVAQAQWIKDHVEERNIQFAIHLGDLVQTASVDSEWQVADKAHKLLDGVVPYSVLPGNHDLDKKGDVLSHNAALYNTYFPPSRFQPNAWYGGHREVDNVCNFALFEQGDLKFMVLSLPFAPTDAMLDWADGILKDHPDRRVIFATHYYLRPEGRGEGGIYGMEGNDGEQIWQKFVRKQPNIFLVVCGHVIGIHHQISSNDAGKPVIELLCDYQGDANGGDGWLQTLRFVPEENKIEVKAYSPTLDAHREEAPHSYVLNYAMTEE